MIITCVNRSLTGFDDAKCIRPDIAKQAEALLKVRMAMAVEAFCWTPSDTGLQRLYACRSWSLNKNGNQHELTATFEKVGR